STTSTERPSPCTCSGRVEGQLRLGLEDILRLEAGLGLVEGTRQWKGHRVEHALRVDRDDPWADVVQTAQIVGGHLVGGRALFGIASLVNADHNGPTGQGLTRQPEPNGA